MPSLLTRAQMNLKGCTYKGVPTRVYLQGSTYKGLPTRVYLQGSTYKGLPTRVYLQRSTYKGLPTKVYLQRSTYKGLPSRVLSFHFILIRFRPVQGRPGHRPRPDWHALHLHALARHRDHVPRVHHAPVRDERPAEGESFVVGLGTSVTQPSLSVKVFLRPLSLFYARNFGIYGI